jgi:flagellar hook-basal body complex protein FliE
MITPASLSAVSAVNPTSVPALAAPASSAAANATPDLSFGQLVDQLANGAVDQLKAGEAAAIAGVQGKASIQHVVDTVMSAERSLQTLIAVRDKAVAAYQEISRMAI